MFAWPPHRTFLLVLLGTLLSASAVVADDPATPAPKPPHWGIGRYNLNDAGTIEDHARWDWALIRCGGGELTAEGVAPYNWFLEANPNLKYVLRLDPPHNGWHPRQPRPLTFLDDRYDKALRHAIRTELRAQIAAFLTHLSKPENVVAFTFSEELPGTWGFPEFRLSADRDVPPLVESFREQIEAERRIPLEWNEVTWRWLGKAFVESVNELHDLIRAEAPDRTIIFWHHSGYPLLDQVDEPVDFEKGQPSVCPFRLTDVIGAPRCDGILGNPADEETWARYYVNPVTENGWLLTAQLSHGGYMRRRSWDATLAMLNQPIPGFLGYMFFCEPQGKPSRLDKPGAQETLEQFTDRFIRCDTDPVHGKVVRITHQGDAAHPFTSRAASWVVQKEQPNHGVHGLEVKPGQTLNWSVMVKTEGVEGKEGAVLCLVFDTPTGVLGNQPVLMAEKGTQDWHPVTGSLVIPDGVVMLRVYLGMRLATGTVWLDQLSFKPEGEDRELIVNGDFEQGDVHPPRWDGWMIDDHSVVLAHWRRFCGQYLTK